MTALVMLHQLKTSTKLPLEQDSNERLTEIKLVCHALRATALLNLGIFSTHNQQ